MKIKIRKASQSDSKILNSFLTKLIQDEKKYDVNINENCVVTYLYENLILSDSNCILVAECENKIVGYLYGYIKENSDAYINPIAQLEAMFVEEEYRNNGIATMLIEVFKEWVKLKNVKYIELKVCNENKNAISLYQKNKFKNTKDIMTVEL